MSNVPPSAANICHYFGNGINFIYDSAIALRDYLEEGALDEKALEHLEKLCENIEARLPPYQKAVRDLKGESLFFKNYRAAEAVPTELDKIDSCLERIEEAIEPLKSANAKRIQLFALKHGQVKEIHSQLEVIKSTYAEVRTIYNSAIMEPEKILDEEVEKIGNYVDDRYYEQHLLLFSIPQAQDFKKTFYKIFLADGDFTKTLKKIEEGCSGPLSCYRSKQLLESVEAMHLIIRNMENQVLSAVGDLQDALTPDRTETHLQAMHFDPNEFDDNDLQALRDQRENALTGVLKIRSAVESFFKAGSQLKRFAHWQKPINSVRESP